MSNEPMASDKFMSMAFHQLRSSLTAIKWFGEMLLEGDAGELNEKQKDYLEKIIQSNEREIQLINDLLNISRIQTGRLKIDPRTVDLEELLRNLVDDERVTLGKNKNKIDLLVGEIPKVEADPELLECVYGHLIKNAICYSMNDEGVTVEVTVKEREILSEITDQGMGIPESEKDKLFTSFFRGLVAMEKNPDGSGLGLFLSKMIVDLYGGKMGYKSEEGKGSTFWFTIPLDGMKKRDGEVGLS